MLSRVHVDIIGVFKVLCTLLHGTLSGVQTASGGQYGWKEKLTRNAKYAVSEFLLNQRS